MKRTSWGCFRAWLLLAAVLCAAPAQAEQAVSARRAYVVAAQAKELPGADAEWRAVDLPHAGVAAAWYRIEFEVPAKRVQWAVYLPYFYGGGQLYLNGAPLAQVAESDEVLAVRWERPFIFAIPDTMLHPGVNQLLVRAAPGHITQPVRMAAPTFGPQTQLLAEQERRRFWVRAMPQFTVIACVIVGLLVLFIWWRRREEILYGLFGLAALLWGGRTLTFVIETLPASWWQAWRLFYYSATGGFIVVLMVFALRLAGTRRPRLEACLFGYWLLGPIGYVASGGSENLASRFWTAGLIPIGIATLVLTAAAAWRQRTLSLAALSVAIGLAVLAGVHDYMLVATSGSHSIAPEWAARRIFMLHYAADFLLLVMGSILSARFVAALQAVEQMNRTLESRVAERERALAENYAQMGRLERQHAAYDERQRIMRDLHDGLGSQLFVTLSRVESGQLPSEGIAQALRDCIADMRLALEAMSPDGNDFLEAWSNFRFRWERQLETAGLRSDWKAQTDDGVLNLAPHAGLHVLRVAQEALTNVLKHANARSVNVELRAQAGKVQLVIADDGRGGTADGRPGRGLVNMRARATRLGGGLEIQATNPGMRVCLEFDQTPAPRAASP